VGRGRNGGRGGEGRGRGRGEGRFRLIRSHVLFLPPSPAERSRRPCEFCLLRLLHWPPHRHGVEGDALRHVVEGVEDQQGHCAGLVMRTLRRPHEIIIRGSIPAISSSCVPAWVPCRRARKRFRELSRTRVRGGQKIELAADVWALQCRTRQRWTRSKSSLGWIIIRTSLRRTIASRPAVEILVARCSPAMPEYPYNPYMCG